MNENVLVVLLVMATGGMAGVIVLGIRATASVAGYRKVAQARRGAEHDPQKSHDGYERPSPRVTLNEAGYPDRQHVGPESVHADFIHVPRRRPGLEPGEDTAPLWMSTYESMGRNKKPTKQ
jgi:hypothetical protein